VETAPGGEAAIASLRGRRFDAVVCDWKMPGLNGVQLHEHLKATDPAMADRMIFMSGDVVSGPFREFLAANGRTCLAKPFSIDELRGSIASLAAAGRQ
jgi:CheY-like chemotaxis protein